MTPDEHNETAMLAQLDRLRAFVRDEYPEQSEAWRDVLILRLLHHKMHNGDMTGAPALPTTDI